jgi:rhodanese-related sulfurtransferase
MRRFRQIGLVFGLAIALLAMQLGAAAEAWRLPWSLPDPADPSVTLSDVERSVASKYPVPEIGGRELAARIGARDVVLFDVRERAEYETSHLAGAIHVAPGTSGAAFLATHGRTLAGKTAVFYCSVGLRSGIMVDRVAKALPAGGARPVVMNLRGGVFRWFREGRALEREGGAATTVHPYDASWGKLLARSLGPGE